MIQDILKQDSNNNIFLCKASIAWAAQKIIEESLLFCVNICTKQHIRKTVLFRRCRAKLCGEWYFEGEVSL